MNLYSNLLSYFIFLFLLTGCSSETSLKFPSVAADGFYDTTFPKEETFQYLETIKNKVKLLNCVAYYSDYLFEEKSRFILRSQNQIFLDSLSSEQRITTKNAAGSATIIYSNLGKILLLTASHIVNFPDTVITYFPNRGDTDKYIESISIKINQDNFIADFPERGEVEVIALDPQADLALVGRHYDRLFSMEFTAIQFPLGAAENLRWGSFVYAIGYPMNYQMVTTGIVSNPRRDEKNSFLIDANFNRGFSGGIVLGILDGIPNFELVGIISMVPASKEFVIRPVQPPDSAQINLNIPYKGELFLDHKRSIIYGITKVTSAESIREFLQNNLDSLKKMGYNPDRFLQKRGVVNKKTAQ